MSTPATVYQRVLEISEDYLGPAAPRFLDRLATNHLGKPANKLTRSDLPELVVWIKLAVTVITEDEALVSGYIGRLEELADTQQIRPAAKKAKRKNQ